MRSVIASAVVLASAGVPALAATGDASPPGAPAASGDAATATPPATLESPLTGLTTLPPPSSTSGVTVTPRPAAPADTAPPEAAAALPSADELRAWDRFHLVFTGGAWFARVTGDIGAGGSAKYDLVDDLGLDSQQVSFAGDVEARWRFLHVRFGGSHFRTSGGNASTGGNLFNDVSVRPGDPTASTFSMWNVGGDIGVDLYRPFADQPFPFGRTSERNRDRNRVPDGGLGGDGGYRADLRLGAFVGVTAFNTDLDFTNLRSNVSTSIDQTWTAVYVGGRVTLDLWLRDHFPILERLSIDADGSFGPVYPGSGSLVQVRAGVTMYPCDNFGVRFGYRLQKIHGDGRGQDLDANFAGLFVGGVLHF